MAYAYMVDQVDRSLLPAILLLHKPLAPLSELQAIVRQIPSYVGPASRKQTACTPEDWTSRMTSHHPSQLAQRHDTPS